VRWNGSNKIFVDRVGRAGYKHLTFHPLVSEAKASRRRESGLEPQGAQRKGGGRGLGSRTRNGQALTNRLTMDADLRRKKRVTGIFGGLIDPERGPSDR
jgi:hypothetical protein